MKYFLPVLIALLLIFSCASEKKETKNTVRWICLSKQYNEIISALNLEKNLVAVDLSSVNPRSIQKIPKVGYHRALAIESILAFNPTLVIHDNNIAPETIITQLNTMDVPMVTFKSDGKSLNSTYELIREMGAYFHVPVRANNLVKRMKDSLKKAKEEVILSNPKPKVLVLHYGRAKNHYLMVTEKSPAAEVVKMAGGQLCIPGEKAMKLVSSELIASYNPEVVLITDFGYDRYKNKKGSVDEIPGLESTAAFKNKRIYRINEYELMYFGTNIGTQVTKVTSLIHQSK
jgi:iron complex transport system substrate-binding protein